MIYKSILFVVGSWFSCAHAAGAYDLNAYLGQPVEARVKLFKAAQPEGEAFLKNLAFDTHVGLQARWRALTTMGRWDAAHFKPELERALKSREWFMRNAALIALQTADRAFAVEWSSRLVTDPALVVRTQAVRNLIRLDARETEGLLWREIFSSRNFRGHESLWVRAHMAEALAHFAGAGKAKLFEKLLQESDTRLHKWAVMGLENTTGFKLTDRSEPVSVRRQKWLARLDAETSI